MVWYAMSRVVNDHDAVRRMMGPYSTAEEALECDTIEAIHSAARGPVSMRQTAQVEPISIGASDAAVYSRMLGVGVDQTSARRPLRRIDGIMTSALARDAALRHLPL